MRNFLFFIFYFSIVQNSISQNRVSIFDIKYYSGVQDNSNIFSVDHSLKVAGVPFSIFNSFDHASKNPIVIIPSLIDVDYFSNELIDSLNNYVSQGGIIFFSQVKETKLFNLAGVDSYQYFSSYKNVFGNLERLQNESYFLNTSEEVNLKICDSSFVTGINCRGYTLNTAVSLASFDDGLSAISKNAFGNGFVYLMGMSWEDVILRNQ